MSLLLLLFMDGTAKYSEDEKGRSSGEVDDDDDEDVLA